jgi:hypothetical protein
MLEQKTLAFKAPYQTLITMAPIPTLSFKCAVITGGYSGLGRAMAQALIKRVNLQSSLAAQDQKPSLLRERLVLLATMNLTLAMSKSLTELWNSAAMSNISLPWHLGSWLCLNSSHLTVTTD